MIAGLQQIEHGCMVVLQQQLPLVYRQIKEEVVPKTPRANKAKGRTYQNYIARELMKVVPGKLKGQLMGQSGTDIIDIDNVLPWDYTEVKHHKLYPSLEKLNRLATSEKGKQIFFVRANRSPNLVIMNLEMFQELLAAIYAADR